MTLSIIAISYNTKELLLQCLQAVEQTVVAVDYEIIVVDNASRDGSAEMVHTLFPRAHLLANNHNVGFAAANIRASRGEFLLLLNSDAVLLPGAVDSMLACMREEPRVGVVGGKLLNPDGSFQHSFANFPTVWSEVLLLTRLYRLVLPATYPSYPERRSMERRAVDWVSGALLMARREAVDGVGLLDEAFFMYTEEVDWCYRMRADGWQVLYLPEAGAVHRAAGSEHAQADGKRAQLYHSKWLFLRKHRGRVSAWVFRSLVLLVSSLNLFLWMLRALVKRGDARRNARRRARSYRNVVAQQW